MQRPERGVVAADSRLQAATAVVLGGEDTVARSDDQATDGRSDGPRGATSKVVAAQRGISHVDGVLPAELKDSGIGAQPVPPGGAAFERPARSR